MRRRRTIVSHLGAAACVGLFLSGGVPPAVPLACLLAIFLDTAWLAPRGWQPRASVLLALQLALALPVLYLALLKDPPVDFLTLLLLAAAPLIVIRSLHGETEFNSFLIILLSLLVVVGSAALAPGAMPVLITAIYVLVGCQALRALSAGSAGRRGNVTFRLERPAGWWRAAPALAAHHLGMGGLFLGALFYLVAPRPFAPSGEAREGGLGSGGGDRRESRTVVARSDFPREVRIGDIAKIKRRPYPALQVEIRARGLPFDPGPAERAMLLLRARAWERYAPAARRWEPSRDSPRALPASGILEPGATELDWSFDILGYDGKTLFLPPRARRVRAAGGELAVDRTGGVTSSVPVFQYSVASAWPVRPDEVPGLLPDVRDHALLQVPDAAARVLLPHVPAAPRGNVEAAVTAVAGFFRNGGFRYTLDLPPSIDRAPDPLLAFLEEREGDCELYATTACLLLRTMAVPARVAGGLRCSERLGPGRYQARFSNAHAWVEVPCEGVGFVAFDFTPPDSAARPAAGAGTEGDAADEGGRGGEEAAVLDWRDPFDYGALEQEQVVDWIGGLLLDWKVLAAVLGLVLLLALPPGLAALRERPPSPLRVTAPPGKKRSTLVFYAHWLRECAARGHVRARVQTPREFLASLPPEMRDAGGRITLDFERLRYGPPAAP